MQIETKMNVGDICYFMDNNEVQSLGIVRIEVNVVGSDRVCGVHHTEISYIVPNGKACRVPEEKAFKTKEDLLNSL